MRDLRIGFIGAGNNTCVRHLPGFQRLPGVRLETVCNSTAESSARVAREFGIKRTAPDWCAVVEDPEVDAVCIGTPPFLHAEATIAALRAGKHVLTEARMAANLVEAEAMLEEARRRPHLVAQIVPAPFSLDFDESVREVLASGALGDLREVFVVHTEGSGANAAAPLSFRHVRAQSGVNTLAFGIFHEIVLRWLDQDPLLVAADAARFTPVRADRFGKLVAPDIPETLTVLARLPLGARVVYHFSALEAGGGRSEIRLNGSRGCLRFDVAKGQLFISDNASGMTREVVPAELRGWRVEADFIDSIRTGAPVRLTPFSEGVRYMRFTQQVWDSWNAHHPLSQPEDSAAL